MSALCLAECIVFLRKAAGWNQGQGSFVHGSGHFRPHIHAMMKTWWNTFLPDIFFYRKLSDTKCSGNGLHGALTTDLFVPQSVASQIYHSQSALRFYNVGFPLRDPALGLKCKIHFGLNLLLHIKNTEKLSQALCLLLKRNWWFCSPSKLSCMFNSVVFVFIVVSLWQPGFKCPPLPLSLCFGRVLGGCVAFTGLREYRVPSSGEKGLRYPGGVSEGPEDLWQHHQRLQVQCLNSPSPIPSPSCS